MRQDDQPNTKVNTHLEQLIQAILGDRPIAYHAILARALGSATAGIFLSQLLYWIPRATVGGGWVWKTQDQVYEETALTRREQETARRILREAGILEERLAGVPARLHYTVNMQSLINLLGAYQQRASTAQLPATTESSEAQERKVSSQFGGKRQTSMAESAKPVSANPPHKQGGKRPTITETTIETTQQENGVVAELIAFKVSPTVAKRLARDFAEEYILEKLDLVRWLVDSNSTLVTENPAGYLRRAIEEDFSPPPGYKTKAERESEAEESRQRELAWREAEQRSAEEIMAAKEEARRRLRSLYPPVAIAGTKLTTEDAWQQTLEQLRDKMTTGNFNIWIRETYLASVNGGRAIIIGENEFQTDELASRFDRMIARTLSSVLDRPVSCEYRPMNGKGMSN